MRGLDLRILAAAPRKRLFRMDRRVKPGGDEENQEIEMYSLDSRAFPVVPRLRPTISLKSLP